MPKLENENFNGNVGDIKMQHKIKATEYATLKGASKATINAWAKAETDRIDYGTVQSANTSAEFLSRVILKQKQKFKK